MKKTISSIILILGIAYIGLAPNTVFSHENHVGVGASDEVQEINDDIDEKKKEISEIEEKIKVYEDSINAKKEEALTLENEIAVIEDQISKKNLDIEKSKKELQAIQLEIKRLETKISDKEAEIDNQKEKLKDLVKTLYKHDKKTYLEITLTKNSLSDFFQEIKYLEEIQQDVQGSLDNIKVLKESLQKQKEEEVTKKTEAEGIKAKLEGEKESLGGQRDHKDELLDKTKYTEEEFQRLVQELKNSEQQVNNDIYNLENLARKKLQEQQQRGEDGEEEDDRDPFELGPAQLGWPTTSRRITAYFHDPSYPYRYIFEHPAIDIGIGQGTPLYASADGIVAIARKKDWVYDGNGNALYPAYNYVTLVHNDGLSTVYGHMSEIYVSVDEYVRKGDIIGKSGGAPGTAGAGRLTTGAHLHFEVRLNGIPVNPLDYLP